MKRRFWTLFAVLVVLPLIIMACAGEPETITVVQTVVVKEEVIVEGEPQIVEKVVTEVVEKEVEVVVEKEVEVEVTQIVEKEVEVVVEKEVEVQVTVEVQVESEASGGEADRRKTVIFDIDGGRVVDPENWNPFVPGRRLDQGYHQAMIEPLFILNYESGEIEPWLGESMESNEAFDVWTLKIREGIKWSDGEDYDSDDVVFSINMLIDNSPELANSAQLAEWVDSVEAVDATTIQFNLTKPNPRFQLDNFSVKIWGGVNIVPEHIWADQDPLTFTNYDPAQGWPVFTGPYLLDRVNETEFNYARNDDWWGVAAGFKDKLPAPEKLVWVWYGPEETRTAAMANNGLDSLMDVTLGAFLALQQRNPNVVAWYDQLPYAWLDPCSRTFEFNNTVAPWDDPEMRWALNYAINRDEILVIAYEGTTLPSRHFFPAYPPLNRYVDLLEDAGLYETYPISEHNPDKAKEIIESKGYVFNDGTGYYEKDGKELTIDITTHEAFIEKQRIAQVLVEQFQVLGINATNRNEAGGTWSDNFDFGEFESRMGWHQCGSINEPWASMDTFNSKWSLPVGERSTKNAWRWENEEYSAIVDQIGTMPLGDPEIDTLFVEAMDLWMAELPVIPVTQAKKLIPFDNTYWTNWPTAENNYLHSTTWWQSTHKILHELEPAQ